MNESDRWYSAIRSRDRRFDGLFYMGVITTGVYCRPVCPARTPRAENVRYFRSAAAAENAGFRPCLRCRPERVPSSVEPSSVHPVVARALQLISTGFLDGADVGSLGRELGVSERQLRRLFDETVGASPQSVAQTKRIQFAKRLVDESNLSMIEIAFSAGFSSLRRFNDAFLKVYGRPPSSFRKTASSRTKAGASPLQLRLPVRAPFCWPRLLAYFRTRAIAGVESVDDTTYRRSVRLGGAGGVLEVALDESGDRLAVTISSELVPHVREVVERVHRMFDTRANIPEIERHLQADPRFADIVDHGLVSRVPGCWDLFELVVRAILGQRVSVRAATTFAARVAEVAGQKLGDERHPELKRFFPTPAEIVDVSLAGLGVTGVRIEAIRSIARAFAAGEAPLAGYGGLDEAISRLCKMPGIGEWTANYIALRGLGEPDAFPAGDLVLRKVAGGSQPCSERELNDIAQAWRPWRAYAALALWTVASARASTAGERERHDDDTETAVGG